MRTVMRSSLQRTAWLIALCACVPLAHAGYMTAKAGLAQILLQRAWQQRLETGVAAKPWPWAQVWGTPGTPEMVTTCKTCWK